MVEQLKIRTKKIGLEVIKLVDELPNKQSAWATGKQASKAGNDYRYFMVYERRTVDGAYKLEDFLSIMKDI